MTTRDLNILRHYAWNKASVNLHVRTFTENNDEIGSNAYLEAAAFNGNTKKTKAHEYKTIFNEFFLKNSTQPVELL